jgi:hypothetical protein
MKWIKNQNGPYFEHYSLQKDDKTVLELKFNYHTNTARAQWEGEKRAFMIDNSASLKHKILVLNEYGFEFGQLNYENELSAEGFIQIENKELRYVINTSVAPRIILYNESSPAPVVSCILPEKSAVDFSLNKNIKNSPVNGALMLLLGWYLNLPVLRTHAMLVD